MVDIMKGFKPKTVTYVAREAGSSEVLGSIQVSKGRTTFKNLAVVEVKGSYYLIQYQEGLPKERYWVGEDYVQTRSFMCEKISNTLATAVSNAISNFKKEDHKSHLNPYSYIYGYVVGWEGVSLHELWSFKVD